MSVRIVPRLPGAGGASFLLVALTALAPAGCWDRTTPELEVRLESGFLAESASPEPSLPWPGEPVRFVYASVLSPERSTLTYAHLSTYLSTKLQRNVEIVRRRTYAELNELLRTGGADAGLVCTGAFAAGADEFGLEPIAVPVIAGKRTYQSYVIARRYSGFADFRDLEGASFAFTDPLSNTGYRYVVARLHDLGLDPESFFSRVLFTYSHDNSIEAVQDGIVDAGSVDSLIWDELVRRDPSLGQRLVIVERSEEFPINPLAASPLIDPELRSQLEAVFLGMADDPDGRRILEELGTEAFVEPTDQELAGYRAIGRSWQALAAAHLPAGTGSH